jgi:hypothetical protein
MVGFCIFGVLLHPLFEHAARFRSVAGSKQVFRADLRRTKRNQRDNRES